MSDAQVQQWIAEACVQKLAVSFCERQALALAADFFGGLGACSAIEAACEACEVTSSLDCHIFNLT